jgi:hypothetical protein
MGGHEYVFALPFSKNCGASARPTPNYDYNPKFSHRHRDLIFSRA